MNDGRSALWCTTLAAIWMPSAFWQEDERIQTDIVPHGNHRLKAQCAVNHVHNHSLPHLG
ncbi:MAG TPA: hypothetical protein VNN62_00055 [Methylomirabilota bacterium]|jgi:hypothetical protein|nr:hypothetical protein [Methylomirabilota bacterium]